MKRTFISFDFENDEELRDALVGQARNPDSPFEIADYSIKEPIEEKWKEKARSQIRAADLVTIICGENTDTAKGVAAEMTITCEEQKPYFLLRGRPHGNCKKPAMALKADEIYPRSWENLKLLIEGRR